MVWLVPSVMFFKEVLALNPKPSLVEVPSQMMSVGLTWGSAHRHKRNYFPSILRPAVWEQSAGSRPLTVATECRSTRNRRKIGDGTHETYGRRTGSWVRVGDRVPMAILSPWGRQALSNHAWQMDRCTH